MSCSNLSNNECINSPACSLQQNKGRGNLDYFVNKYRCVDISDVCKNYDRFTCIDYQCTWDDINNKCYNHIPLDNVSSVVVHNSNVVA